MNINLLLALIQLINDKPGLTGREYAKILNIVGFPNINKHIVNSYLYSNRIIFFPNFNEYQKPAWTIPNPPDSLRQSRVRSEIDEQYILHAEQSGATKIVLPKEANFQNVLIDPESTFDEIEDWNSELELYPWQERALNQWKEGGYNGIVEAVTGGGKTRLAVGAIEAHLKNGWRVAILVPSKELQKQWYQVINENLNIRLNNHYKIGYLGNGFRQSLAHIDILIATSHSASKFCMLPAGHKGIIVADECHHYGSKTWYKCLEKGFKRRLGLTATYERQDNGLEKYLSNYFNEISYQLDFDEARDEKVIAPFKVAFVGVNFTVDEQVKYDSADSLCRKLRNKLINDYGIDAEPFDEFMKQVNRLAEGGQGEATIAARKYRTAVINRRNIISNAQQKSEALKLLSPAVKAAERSILFAQTKEASKYATKVMQENGIRAEVLDSDMSMEQRKTVFAAFEDGMHELIAAPLLLDEGVDVPSADLAIVVAASRSRRQMIQRMGRVLRKKTDGRMARLVIIYVEGTVEDPKLGANETFVEMIIDAAIDIRHFNLNDQPENLIEYLNDFYEHEE